MRAADGYVKFIEAPFRINVRIGARAPSWINITFDYFSIANPLENELYSSSLDAYQI